MKFEVRPDPAFPAGGHALLIVPEGASVGSGLLAVRRVYDGKYLGAEGWQAARTLIGPFATSPAGSGAAVALGPAVVSCLEEFDNLEIAFEGGAKGDAVWPEDILLPPDAAAAGGLRRPPEQGSSSGGTIRAEAAGRTAQAPQAPPEASAAAQPDAPEEEPAAGRGRPPPRKRSRLLAAIAALLVIGAVAALAALGELPFGDIARLLGLENGRTNGVGACSNSAFAAGRDAIPATVIELVYRCAEAEGISPEVRLSAVERLLDRSPEALVVMGRWYDPRYFEEHLSPFEKPAVEIAARYYFEAKQAGASEAGALLRKVCEALDPNDLMQDNSRQLYCQE